MQISVNKTNFIVLFFLFNLCLSSFYLDTAKRWNTTSRVLPVLTLTEEGTLVIDKYEWKTGDKGRVDGHYYSDKPPFPSFLIFPFYKCLNFMGFYHNPLDDNTFGNPVYLLGSFLCGSLPFSLLITLIFSVLLDSKNNVISPVLMAMFPMYGSYLFVYAGTFFSHILAGSLISFALFQIKKHEHYFIAGLLCGIATLSELTIGFICVFWLLKIVFFEKNTKYALNFFLGLLPFALFFMAYNYFLTGSPIKFIYHFVTEEEFRGSSSTLGILGFDLNSFFQLVVSDYKGVLMHFPFFLILLPTVFIMIKSVFKNVFSFYSIPVFVCWLIVLSSHQIWHGGSCLGPRQLIPFVMLLWFEVILNFNKFFIKKTYFVFLSVFGLLLFLCAKISINYSVSEEFIHPFTDVVIPEIQKGEFNPYNNLTLFFSTPPNYAALIWLFLFVTGTGILYIICDRVKLTVSKK